MMSRWSQVARKRGEIGRPRQLDESKGRWSQQRSKKKVETYR